MNKKYNAYKKGENSIWNYCEHPFKTFIPEAATKLIIGTFPTYHKNYVPTFEFYYGSENNRFWNTLGRVLNKQFKNHVGMDAVAERKKILETHGIGITDMLLKCYRKGTSSKDEDLYPVMFNDIFKLLSEHTSITKLILTSRTRIFGALGLLQTYFIQNGESLNEINQGEDRILRTSFNFQNRDFEILIPHSTSARNEHVTEDELFEMYRVCLE